jgi:hypothetical protein
MRTTSPSLASRCWFVLRSAQRDSKTLPTRFMYHTGSRRVELLPATRQDTGGWRQLSAVVPVESDASGAPQFSLRIEIRASEGAAAGTLWIDEAQALSTRAVIRMNRLPNGLRLAYTTSTVIGILIAIWICHSGS